MRVAGLILLHFSDADIHEGAIHKFDAHCEHGPRKCNAERKKSEVVHEGSSPPSGVEELVIGAVDNDSLML
jgi:hypothetical protein